MRAAIEQLLVDWPNSFQAKAQQRRLGTLR